MGPWKSDFEMLIPHCSPSRLAEVARDHGGSRTKVGLIVRVRDGRIRARYNELSRQSTAPLLIGRLLQESAGTRIVGEVQWTNVIAAPFVTVVLGVGCLAVGARVTTEGNPFLGFCILLGALAFGALSIKGFRSEGSERAYEEARLRKELLSRFAKHGHG